MLSFVHRMVDSLGPGFLLPHIGPLLHVLILGGGGGGGEGEGGASVVGEPTDTIEILQVTSLTIALKHTEEGRRN